MRNRSLIRLLVLALAALGLAAACGDDDSSPAAADDGAPGAFPVTVRAGGLETTVDAVPRAIVSLSPSATEMLFAVGAGAQVVAVDDQSTFPPEAPVTDLSGYEPNVEAVIAVEPDLVVIDADRNDIVAGLDAVGIPVLVLPAAAGIDDIYTQIEVVGAVTGQVAEAATVVLGMQSDIAELVDRVPESDVALTYFHELDSTPYTVTSNTFIGAVYALAGLENIADEADPGNDYPQLSPEFLVEADPDLVFLADAQYGETAETFAARPGFSSMRSVVEGNVVELDADVSSRWGPRIVDFLRTIVEATAAVGARG